MNNTLPIPLEPEKKILLTKEYRIEQKNWDLRLPGGKVIDTLTEYNEFLKNGKDITKKALEAAKKETREEAGLEAEEIKFLGISRCGATIIWDLYYFVVTKYSQIPGGQELETGENIQLNWVALKEAKQMCLDGRIKEDRSAAMLIRYLKTFIT